MTSGGSEGPSAGGRPASGGGVAHGGAASGGGLGDSTGGRGVGGGDGAGGDATSGGSGGASSGGQGGVGGADASGGASSGGQGVGGASVGGGGSGGADESGGASSGGQGVGGAGIGGSGAGGADASGGAGGTSAEPFPDPLAIGGPLTSQNFGAEPFLTPASVDEVLEGGFSLGREFFVGDWIPAPNTTRPTLDGLGPLFHAPSCLSCHPASGRAPTLGSNGAVQFGLLFRLMRLREGGGFEAGDPVYGGQLQPSSLPGVPVEGTISWAADPERPAGVSTLSPRPLFSITTGSYGPLDGATRFGARLSPQLVGMGFFEHVSESEILAWEDPEDLDGDGISGRAARIPTSNGPRVGRFGWKAIHATLRAQTSAAFVGDIGITSPDHPSDDCTSTQLACLAQPNGGNPEFNALGLEAVDEFMTYLAVPAARRDNLDPLILEGNELFFDIGCAACHRPSLTIGELSAVPLLAHEIFYPYTDLLLHDLGEGLADPIGEGDAEASEWRTPPLWGLGLVEGRPGARFLHDGRAASLVDAILWHGGEALRSRDAFASLTDDEKGSLLAFLRSL